MKYVLFHVKVKFILHTLLFINNQGSIKSPYILSIHTKKNLAHPKILGSATYIHSFNNILTLLQSLIILQIL